MACKMEERQNERNAQDTEHDKRFNVPKITATVSQEFIVTDEEKQAPGQKQTNEYCENRAPVERYFLVIHHSGVYSLSDLRHFPGFDLMRSWPGRKDFSVKAISKPPQVVFETVGELAGLRVIG